MGKKRKYNKATNKELRKIADEYLNGTGLKKSAEKFGYCVNVAERALRVFRLKARPKGETKTKAKKETLRKIANLYLTGLTLEASAREFGYSLGVATRALKVFGLKTRTISEAVRKYAVDETFFEKIDTEEKAYWLGFISADGCVYDTTLKIGLNQADVGHLKKLKKDIKSEHIITETENYDKRTNKRYKVCSITIYSKKIVDDLKKLGIVPVKSLILKACPFVPENLLWHYWRGVIDGDGCISFDNSTKSWEIGVAGTKEICDALLDFICEKLENKRVKIRQAFKDGKNTYRLKIGGNIQVKKICFLFYENSLIFLDRKHVLASQITNTKFPSEMSTLEKINQKEKENICKDRVSGWFIKDLKMPINPFAFKKLKIKCLKRSKN